MHCTTHSLHYHQTPHIFETCTNPSRTYHGLFCQIYKCASCSLRLCQDCAASGDFEEHEIVKPLVLKKRPGKIAEMQLFLSPKPMNYRGLEDLARFGWLLMRMREEKKRWMMKVEGPKVKGVFDCRG